MGRPWLRYRRGVAWVDPGYAVAAAWHGQVLVAPQREKGLPVFFTLRRRTSLLPSKSEFLVLPFLRYIHSRPIPAITVDAGETVHIML